MSEGGAGRAAGAAPGSRCAVAALIGAPNTGKSTLVNRLAGAKVSIVTHKVQTTRSRIRGIAIAGGAQLILVDTPGIFAPKRRLDRAMVEAAWSSAWDADVTVVIVDAAKGLDADAERILDNLEDVKVRRLLVLNKIDLVKKKALLALVDEANKRADFERVFMISALTGDGVGDLMAHLAETAPPGPWLYPEDQISDAPVRHSAAEITREKMYLRLHEELPYASTVETTDWKTLKDGSVRIEQTIYVMRESQRKIVLGKGGRTIKAISTEARREIADMAEAPVHLFLFVKVRQKWEDDPERYTEMGLDFPKD